MTNCRDVPEKTHIFHTFFAIFCPKFFSCKTTYVIFKVVYQASHIPKIRKLYGLVTKKCKKMHIFHTFFTIFGKKFFFSKIRLHQFLVTTKSYLDTKNQKKLMSRSSAIFRTDERMSANL